MTLQRILEEFFRAVARGLEQFARGFAVFPTIIANAILPITSLSVRIDGTPRQRGDLQDRIAEITDHLKRSGSDAHALLIELEQVIEARRQQLLDAQGRLHMLQFEESEVKERVELLRAVKPEAAVAINNLLDESLEARDKRSARRDWLIFGMGVLLSTAISLAFFLLA